MAQRTRTQYKALYGTSGTVFPDNTTAEISEGDVRAFGEDGADSIPFTADDSYTWPFPSANASGTDTYTATLSPAITAYASGQKVQLVFANANTGAATINLNGLGAKAITKNGATALAAGDISAGQALFLYYDGTQFQIQGGGGGGTGTVESVTGDGVNNTDAANPVLSFPNASEVAFTPAGNIAATDVQAAIEELDTEKVAKVNSATALTDGAAIALTAIKHTLTSVEAAITFTITYTGDDISLRVILNATSAVYTFPAGALCISEGVASGDNTCPLAGVSGDKYVITIKHWGSAEYTVVCKNEGQ